jgi:hypothetical protein
MQNRIGGSAMKRVRKLLIGAVSAFALSALPVHLDLGSLGSYDLSSAQAAKGGNGGGGGNGNGGGGNGGGGGKSNGGGHGNGGKAGGSSHSNKAGGKSASAAGHSGSLFSKSHSRSGKVTQKSKSSSQFAEKRGSASKVKAAKANSVRTELAALPQTMVAPELQATVKEKNLHAKLAGLNSLNRNYHAYLNSQDPRMAAIRDYVTAYAELEANFDEAFAASDLSTIYSQDPTLSDPTLSDLQDRLNELRDQDTLSREEEIEKDALEAFLDGADDEALKEALLDAANKNRVEQYGDNYLDGDVMDWAREVLGVGDAIGKIDEVRESLETSN